MTSLSSDQLVLYWIIVVTLAFIVLFLLYRIGIRRRIDSYGSVDQAVLSIVKRSEDLATRLGRVEEQLRQRQFANESQIAREVREEIRRAGNDIAIDLYG